MITKKPTDRDWNNSERRKKAIELFLGKNPEGSQKHKKEMEDLNSGDWVYEFKRRLKARNKQHIEGKLDHRSLLTELLITHYGAERPLLSQGSKFKVEFVEPATSGTLNELVRVKKVSIFKHYYILLKLKVNYWLGRNILP